MQKILLLGKDGMAGHVVNSYLGSLGKYSILTTTRKKTSSSSKSILFDAEDPKQALKIIKQHKPDVIINCIGLLIKNSRENPDSAIMINSYLPRFLARYSTIYKYKLVHMSTDCVFSGKRGGYKETDIPDADDVYGRTKALGEVNDSHNLTIRTSIIGPEMNPIGEGLFQWFFRQKGEVHGYKKVFWTGVTTLELAKQIDHMISDHTTGLVHLSQRKKISKYDLLRIINEVFKLGIDVKPSSEKRSDKSLISTRKGIAQDLPSYHDMMTELKEWMLENRINYNAQIYNFLKD